MQTTSEAFNKDYRLVTPNYPDNFFDIVIADIPYGIGAGKMAFTQESTQKVKQKNGSILSTKRDKHSLKEWDKECPKQDYFDEVRRVSKHQIIFGVEYVDWTGLVSGRIKWDKCIPDGVSFKKHELAYCSLIDYELELKLLWSGMLQAKSLSEPLKQQGNKKLNEKRIHPTHKPILLYHKLLQLFAKPGMNILDTHLGGVAVE